MNDLKALIGRLNFISGQQDLGSKARRFGLQTAKVMRGPVAAAREAVEGIAEVGQFVETEAGSWIDPEDIDAGGPFDSCDLRHYLAVAERAGVPFVPARQILSLSEEELSSIDQQIPLPSFVSKSITKGLDAVRKDIEAEIGPLEDIKPTESNHRTREEVAEALFDAMDDVPYGWMVRSNIAGSSALKALAGSGVLDDGREGAKIAEGVEVGAGWVTTGNRRRIDATDKRFVETFTQGHKDEIHYLARPWMDVGRFGEGEDPHRHGTPFAGKGKWPMEWRVFIEDGVITGVASYYPWVGSATPENAAKALEAVALAEKIADTMAELSLVPRTMDTEMLRWTATGAKKVHPLHLETLERFPRDGISCTLDFIETTDGMMLLEGGPPHTPIGGGHPCAFAGHDVDPSRGLGARCEGVALRLMDHVILADPKTWRHGDTDGCILSWEEARSLAAHYEDDMSPEF